MTDEAEGVQLPHPDSPAYWREAYREMIEVSNNHLSDARFYSARCKDLMATLARVKALADEWGGDHGILSPDSRYTRDVLLRELRAALRGEYDDKEALNG